MSIAKNIVYGLKRSSAKVFPAQIIVLRRRRFWIISNNGDKFRPFPIRAKVRNFARLQVGNIALTCRNYHSSVESYSSVQWNLIILWNNSSDETKICYLLSLWFKSCTRGSNGRRPNRALSGRGRRRCKYWLARLRCKRETIAIDRDRPHNWKTGKYIGDMGDGNTMFYTGFLPHEL